MHAAAEWYKGGLTHRRTDHLHIEANYTSTNVIKVQGATHDKPELKQQGQHNQKHKSKSYKRKKIPNGAVGSLHEPPPTTVAKAPNHPTRSWGWLQALLDEWLGLEDLGVLCHGHTLQQCRDMGITSSPGRGIVWPMSLPSTS